MKLRLLSTVVGVAALAVLAATAIAGYGATSPNKLHASLNGAREVPGPGDSNGSGRATITLHPATERVCFNISFSGIGRALAGHIHKAPRGVAGPISISLFDRSSGLTSPARGCVNDISHRKIRALRSHPGRFYVNVHTAQFPDGAIRGQLHH
jgi:CHRD domain